MNAIIDWALQRSRATLSVMAFFVLTGLVSYNLIPVELEPNIEVPIVVVTVPHEGISPEDAERLILLPIEAEIRSLEGIEEVTSYGAEGSATLVIEFEIQIDSDDAVTDVNEALDRARSKIPSTAEEPIVNSVSASDFPAVVVNFTGKDVPERTLYSLATKLQEDLEREPMILEARLSGDREELLEVILDRTLMESYAISNEELINNVVQNNRLVAAGFLNTGNGRFAVKVPSVIETNTDIRDIPVKKDGDTVITLDQIADIRRTFKDRESFARVNGQPSISIEVVKRIDANMLDTVARVRELVESSRPTYPKKVNVFYTTDQAPDALRQVNELKGNILTAMMLVMVLVVAALGLRSGILVGIGIPLSFLFSCIFLYWIGYTFNFMVMFGMLLALGMLIDGAIVVVEYADRKLAEGRSSQEAYAMAAKRMFWPVTASTATTLAAFLPLFLWPGVSGKFMIHLPVTVFAVLIGSLAYALIFAPTLGSLIGKSGIRKSSNKSRALLALEKGDPTELRSLSGAYARLLRFASGWPLTVLLLTVGVLLSSFYLYGRYGGGVIFFTEQDPIWATISVNARGNLSASEKLDLVLQVEDEVLPIPGVESLYTAVTSSSGGSIRSNTASDRIGYMFLQLHEQTNRAATGLEILESIRERTAHLAGVVVEVKEMENGPPVGKPIQIQFASKFGDLLEPAVARVRNYMATEVAGLRDIDDTRNLPGIQWELTVDRAKAAQYGANVTTVGYAVQLVTNGLKVGEYRPDDALEEVDIRARFPATERGLQALDDLRLSTPQGLVPLSNFVRLQPRASLDTVQRVDGSRVELIRADISPGVLANDKVKEIETWLESQNFDPRINVAFRGANEEQADSGAFLSVAFMIALVLMFIMLVTQFNSFYQSSLIMFAVVMSTAGVLLGLLVTGQNFSVILTGVGIVALAGIVVNNNIVLLDTYNHIRRERPELSTRQAIVLTGAQRLRPVFLTTSTTILGLLPIAAQVSVNLISREIQFASSITSYWAPLSSAIVSGLLFATLLTLITTPVMVALPESLALRMASLRHALHGMRALFPRKKVGTQFESGST